MPAKAVPKNNPRFPWQDCYLKPEIVMPTVTIELAPGRSAEQKVKYVEELTRLTAEVLKCPVESVDIIFVEIPSTSWAKGGKFLAQPV